MVSTWIRRDNQSPSVLDAALLNHAAFQTDCFSDATVSFDDSLGFDHAALAVM